MKIRPRPRRLLAGLGIALVAVLLPAAGASGTGHVTVIDFEDVAPSTGNTDFISDEYAASGLLFVTDDGIVRAGISEGDPGWWGLEGPNGDQFLGFNGSSYAATIELDRNATRVSLQAARSSGSPDWGSSVRLTARCQGTDVASTTHSFGKVNVWGTLAVEAECIDSFQVVGLLGWAGFHPYGIDDLRVTFAPADATAPTLASEVSPSPNEAGWNNTDVTVTWTCVDDGSGVDWESGDLTDDALTASGTAWATCVDVAGNEAVARRDVLIDKVPPSVTVVGVSDGDTYIEGYDDPAPSCETTDDGSGVDHHATLHLGGGPTGEVTATCTGGTDRAGNAAPDESVTYTVLSPEEALMNAIEGALAGESSGTVRSFQQKAASISSAPNDSAKAGKLEAFVNHVEAERGKRLTDEEADLLVALAELI